MRKLISILVVAIAFTLTSNAQNNVKQDAKTSVVSLEQTKGAFTQKSITLTEGSYIFEIANNNVGTDVGFVLVPKSKDASKPENHIKTAYVSKVVKDGTKETSVGTTKLTKGEYVYFCPLNNTPQYTLVVK